MAEAPGRPEPDVHVVVVPDFPADVLKLSSGNGMDPEKPLKRPPKRKRVSIGANISFEERDRLIAGFCEELNTLFKYFKELLAWRLGQEESDYCSNNSAMACMLEGSILPFSVLSVEIYEKLKAREGVTLSSVQRDMHFIGSRLNYGVQSANPNLLEDQSESCLWCWEVRDLKLLPKNKRKISIAQRKGREKVRDRVAALSEMLSILRMQETEGEYQTYFLKASEKLGKTLNVGQICSVFEKLTQKSADEIAEKEAKAKEKELLKEIERNVKNTEKEKKRQDLQLQKEKSQNERELKRRQIEADKEERRREREEAESRKQLSIRKQASMMERFLKNKKCNDLENAVSSKNAVPSDSSQRNGGTEESIIMSMDLALFQQDSVKIDELWMSQTAVWSKFCRSTKFQHWGVRHKPRSVAFNVLKLQGSSCKPESLANIKECKRGNACSYLKVNDKSDSSSLPDEVEENSVNDQSDENNDDVTFTSVQLSKRTTKLIQFDKSHRPAYYGSWSKKSHAVGPRHPFAKDPSLDYDVDSDEEWGEEEPGESLSDYDKDEDEEILDEDPKPDDDNESEDSFFVPDGYLSDNEGVQDEHSDDGSSESRSSPSCTTDIESEECGVLLQQQKQLDYLTQQALRKNQPLIITNLLHEKYEIMRAKNLSGMLKNEQICLQILCLVACSEGSLVEPPFDNLSTDNSDLCQTEKAGNIPIVPASTISDPNLREYVRCIQSSPYVMAKVLDSLQQKFPSLPKSQLRNKVKDVSEFVNNRWQIKKEILEKLGMSESPGKSRQQKGISSFFSSKRCLPPTNEIIDLSESSSHACLKEPALVNEDSHHDCPENLKIRIT